MSADLLKRAAAKLREAASGASPGPLKDAAEPTAKMLDDTANDWQSWTKQGFEFGPEDFDLELAIARAILGESESS